MDLRNVLRERRAVGMDMTYISMQTSAQFGMS